MPLTIVCIFPDRQTSESAIQDLERRGIAPSALTRHPDIPTVANAGTLEIDDLATGGLLTNMGNLLDGLFDRAVPAGHAATMQEVVGSEGTLVSVEVADPAQALQCTQWLTSAGALRTSILPETDTVSFHRLYPALA